MEDKNLTRNILIISAIVIALCIGVGFSFAYFTANIKGNDEAGENIVNAGKMQVTYVDGNLITLDRMKPSDTLTKKFQVKNTGDFPAKYNVKIDEVTNTLVDKTDLRYTLKKNNEKVKEGIVPSGSAYLLTDISIDATETPDEYELIIEFVDTHNNQNDNQGKTFSGKIQIDKESDVILATNPEVKLYQGLIPIDFDGAGNVITADTSDKWYDYTVQEWANAVLVDSANYEKYSSTPNQIIPMEDILQMYVYIPRYKYQLFNVNKETVDPQIIKIVFESNIDSTGDIQCKYTNEGNGNITENCTNIQSGEKAQNGEWYTHPAFTFGDTELPGIWVGKFEPSHTTKSLGNEVTDEYAILNCLNNNCSEANNIRILPNKSSLRYNNLANFFYVTQSLTMSGNPYNLDSNEVDTHIIKNIEWGAVAYLTNSEYGRYRSDGNPIDNGAEVWINNTNDFTTGCAGESVSANKTDTCLDEYKWNTINGVHASTTDNLYGIYDLAGGAFEYTMGNMVDENGNFNPSYSGFEISNGSYNLDVKYYDKYTYGTNNMEINRGHLGDATGETQSWYNDYNNFLYSSYSWIRRGGAMDTSINSGIWNTSNCNDYGFSDHSSRIVLTAE